MKINWKKVIMFVIIGISIIAPIVIGWGVSQDILNDWTNDNDWIGFWGSYAGAVMGGLVTLVVMWNTLEDTKKAREREEKINYYNNLIEVMGTFIADVDNYLVSITRVLKVKGIEPRNLYVQARNQVTKSSSILNAQLCIKMDVINIDNLIATTKEIQKKIEELDEDLGTSIAEQFKQSNTINVVETKRDVLGDELTDLIEKFPKLIKEELEK